MSLIDEWTNQISWQSLFKPKTFYIFLHYYRQPGNDQGEDLAPNLSFNVYDRLGDRITDGVAIRLGDDIQ